MKNELSSENNIRKDLKIYDMIKIGERKYLVLTLKKEKITLLPIDNFLKEGGEGEMITKLSLKYEVLNEYQKIDQTDLLYLLNEKNPLIKKALEYLLYERK